MNTADVTTKDILQEAAAEFYPPTQKEDVSWVKYHQTAFQATEKSSASLPVPQYVCRC